VTGVKLGSSVLMALALVACGGEQKPAQAPVSGPAAPTYQPATGPMGAVATQGGQQFAISDKPSSGTSGPARPQMSANAAQAYSAGLTAFQQGNLEEADRQFKAAAAADANAYQAQYSLGVVEERLGNRASALAAYQKALSIVPDYEPAIVAYALLMARTDHAADAETFLTGRQARMANCAAILAALAEVKSIEGNSGEAQRLAQEALKKNPDYRPAMITLARDHYRTRRLDLALYTLKGILDGYGEENPPRDKKNAEAHLIRGLIYKEQRNRAGAIQEFKQALDLRPDLVDARIQLATYYLESGNASDALGLLEGAIHYDKENVLAHLNLGDTYRLLGRSQDAKQELDWVIARDPNLAQAHYDLGLLFLLATDLKGVAPKQAMDNAIAELEKFRTLQPRSSAGVADDSEELITRAKTKKALLDAQEAEKAAETKPPPAAGAAPPAGAQPAPGTGTKPAAGSSGALPPTTGGKK
jgi:tetratricopeptide (TPR) repeat protein